MSFYSALTLRAALAALAVLAVGLCGPAGAELYAERITAENAAQRRVGGPRAVAGIGDWSLGNGIICAAISDPRHEGDLSPEGGVLIDLGHCGRDDDQWTTFEPLLDFARDDVLEIESVEADVDDSRALLVTRTQHRGIRIVTEYSVSSIHRHALDVVIRMERVRETEENVFAFAHVALHPDTSLRPFTLTRAITGSVGFQHPEADPGSPLTLLSALVPTDMLALVGSAELGPPIAYGVELRDAVRIGPGRKRRPLSQVSVTGTSFSILAFFTEPFWWTPEAVPGPLQLVQVPWLDLALGERIEVFRRIWVGERADVASVSDRLWPTALTAGGSSDDPDARIHVSTADGTPVTQIHTARSGRFRLRLPAGDYRFEARTPDGRSAGAEGSMTGSRSAFAALTLPPPARVTLPGGSPMRLVFRGAAGTPDPLFGDDALGVQIGAESIPASAESDGVSLAGSHADPGELTLPPGDYRVLATRGIEYAVHETRLEVQAGSVAALAIAAPARAVETPGFISADLHVHSGMSFDTSLSPARQLMAFAAQGAEVLVASEHDRVFDPRPLIASLGLAGTIAGVVGVEITSTFEGPPTPYSTGHANAFPVTLRPHAHRGGAPQAEGRRLRQVIAALRVDATEPIVQLNHPRNAEPGVDPEAYFTHLSRDDSGFDPGRPLDEGANALLIEDDPVTGSRDIDLDAIELWNGPQLGAYRRARADWFSLLLQGVRVVGTANSDSHTLRQRVGMPRNYVAVPDDDPARFDPVAFHASLRAGRSYGTSGPLLRVRLGEVGLGDLFHGSSGTLRVGVDAAPWVPVDALRVYVNGALVASRPVSAGSEAVIPLEFSGDGFVTLEAEGPASAEYATLAPGFVPFAFTNPIFVDGDGDGVWVAPGLPETLPPSIGDWRP